LKGDGSECFESLSDFGVRAQISARDVTSPNALAEVMVWDEDAPCGGDGQSYIHYSGDDSIFHGMTAGAGELLHTYKAGVFEDGLPVPQGTIGCYDFTTKGYDEFQPICLQTWKVARFGSSCPEQVKPPPATNAWAVLVSIILVVVILIGLLAWKCRTRQFRTKGYDSGEGATEKVPGETSNDESETEIETTELETETTAIMDTQIV